MKQITSFCLFLVSLLILQSCTNDEIQKPVLKTTSVVITANKTSRNAKSVNDPSIFGNIKDITVTATQTTTGYQASSLFTITNNLNDPTTYNLNNVQEGMNTFAAVATSVTSPKAPNYSSIPRNASNLEVWNTIDTQVAGSPYANYTGSVGPVTIDINILTKLNFTMNTNNGRFIAYFRGNLKVGSQIVVTPYIDEVAQPTFTVDSTNDYYWIWNDSDCIDGKNIRFQCVTKANGNPNFTLQIPNMTIKSHTTSKYAFDIMAKSYTSIPHN